jgi:hypothetical protein
LLPVAALPAFEIFTGPFPVDDRFEVTHYYLEEEDDGFLSVRGELRNHAQQPARPYILRVHLLDKDGLERNVDDGPQDDISVVVLPGQTVPFWAFWSETLPLKDIGSIQFERGPDPVPGPTEVPPVVFEGPQVSPLVPDEERDIGLLRNTGTTLLEVAYTIGYYSPEDIVLWTETPFPEPVLPGATLPVRVKGQDAVRSSAHAATLEGMGVGPDDPITYRIFIIAE